MVTSRPMRQIDLWHVGDMGNLIVDDLMLLLLSEEGRIAGAGTLHFALGGAVLAELALEGAVVLEEPQSRWRSAKVIGQKVPAPADPLLAQAFATLSEKDNAVQTALARIGPKLRKAVLERLVERGYVTAETRRVLLIKTTKYPEVDGSHEAKIRATLLAVLTGAATPDDRSAALIALVQASGQLRSVFPVPKEERNAVEQRAKDIAEGNWGAEGVSAAIKQMQAAIAASATLTASTVATGAATSS